MKRSPRMHSRNEAKRQKLHLAPGVRGVFVSASSFGAGHKAAKEVALLFERCVEEIEGAPPRLPSERVYAGELPTASDENNESQSKDADAKTGGEETKNGSDNNDNNASFNDYGAKIAAELSLSENRESSDARDSGQALKRGSIRDTRRFYYIPEVTKGVSFVQFNRETDEPAEVCRLLLHRSRCRSSTSFSCRFAAKLVPVEVTCKPHLEEFKEALRKVVLKHFPLSAVAKEQQESDTEAVNGDPKEACQQDTEKEAQLPEVTKLDDADKKRETGVDVPVAQPEKSSDSPANEEPASGGGEEKESENKANGGAQVKWGVVYNVRQNMRTMPRETVYEMAGKMVGSNGIYKVDLGNPDVVILIEVNPIMCGISVCKDFYDLAKYNLYRICHPEEEQAQEVKAIN